MNASASLLWEYVLAVTLEFRELVRDDRAQTLAEYSVILTVIAVGVITPTVILMRGALMDAFNSATDCINRVTC